MAEYLIVESGTPGRSPLPDAAVTLAEAGHRVVLLHIGDGVFATTSRTALEPLLEAGCEVWADTISAELRRLRTDDLCGEVRTVGMPEFVDALLDERIRVVWR
jgi:predicted peroxiredoxin